MNYDVIRLENIPSRNECFVQIMFSDEATGCTIPYAQWITGEAYTRYSADPESLPAIVAEWETAAKQSYYDTSVVTPAQARLALLNAGLLDDIDAFMATQSRLVQLAWEYTTEVRRDSPLLLQAAASLGMTHEQLDALFAAAKQIQI